MILVTGGGGFLGRHIVSRLRSEGHEVRIMARGDHSVMRRDGVQLLRGDVADADAVARAVKGCTAVIHTAARVGYWGPYREYEAVNVQGTKNLLRAAGAEGIRAFVFTSSPSVVIGKGSANFEGADEALPYPEHFLGAYQATKARAEASVLQADTPAGLRTLALRPHFIFGPGDPHIVSRLVARARAGRLRRVGDGRNRVDVTYVTNAADAHVKALQVLLSRPEHAAGRTYFIGQESPIGLWDFVDQALTAHSAPAVRRGLSLGAAYRLGAALEIGYRGLGIRAEPPLTRMAALILGTHHHFSHRRAQESFGYSPAVSLDEALSRTFGVRVAARTPVSSPEAIHTPSLS